MRRKDSSRRISFFQQRTGQKEESHSGDEKGE